MYNPFTSGRTPPFSNAVIGMVLIIAGSLIMTIGAKGAAGSGLLLDPEKAREDLKPFSESKGKMINDMISNIDVVDRISRPQEEKEVIRIKCRSCGVLNDEDAKYCKGCAEELKIFENGPAQIFIRQAVNTVPAVNYIYR